MTDISQLSDDELRTLYAQQKTQVSGADLSNMSDDELITLHRQALTRQHAPGVTGMPGEGGSEGELTSTRGRRGDMVAGSRLKSDLGSTTLQGISAGFSDEALAGAYTPFVALSNAVRGEGPTSPGEVYDQELDLPRSMIDATREARPILAPASEIAGGIVGAAMPAGSIMRGASMASKIGRGAAAGAAYGATSGFGAGEGREDRLFGAATGAAVGAAVGSAATPIARGVGKAYGAVADAVAVGSRDIAKRAGSSTPAFSRVADAYAEDASTGMLRAPNDADLALNLGPQMAARAEGIATQPGEGRNVIMKAVGAQAEQAGGRIKTVVDRALGRDAGRTLDATGVEAERKAAGQLYQAARSSTQKLDTLPVRNALDQATAQADGSVRTALEEVRKLRAFAPGRIRDGASADDLHSARMAIDDKIRAMGLGTNAARLLGEVRDGINTLLKTIPGYRQADTAYKVALEARDALQAGRDVFTRGYGSPDELQAELAKMAPSVRDRFVKGARDAITQIMGTARNDAAAARRELLEKGWNREKLELLIGKPQAAQFTGMLEREAARARDAQNLFGNSRTAMRQEAQKAFPNPDGSNPDLKGTSLVGALLQSGNYVLGKLTGSRRAEISRQAAMLLSRKAKDVEPFLQEALRLTGKRLNVRQQVELVSTAIATGSIPSLAGGVRETGLTGAGR